MSSQGNSPAIAGEKPVETRRMSTPGENIESVLVKKAVRNKGGVRSENDTYMAIYIGGVEN